PASTPIYTLSLHAALPIYKRGTLDLDYTEHPRAPVWTARAIDGKTVDLAALRGRVVVLNFFDQDCPHCQKDLPRLVPVLKEFRRDRKSTRLNSSHVSISYA